ncbi:MAG: hypothetical protein CMO46_02280 [Verrucomicrobiales bacterium]|nr:hypothetical protein [Verrucomicrobiales bacterium]MBD28426.1 hypothetical protein [Verrucomicrobiaceae bacterium]|tara:strand:- start:5143 stop:6885 length:1743 start_codon:yes stop_codon:yes gene_type:complete
MESKKTGSTNALNSQFEVVIGHVTCRIFIAIFIIIITIPPIYRNAFDVSSYFDNKSTDQTSSAAPILKIFKKQKGLSLKDHFNDFEKNLESAIFIEPPRKIIQSCLSLGPLKEGNRKTIIGEEGWLFFRNALSALTGYGPLKEEPDFVNKDPNIKRGNSPLSIIKEFAQQLDDFGTHLVLVNIPSKAMIYPDKISKNLESPIRHPDAQKFFADLKSVPNLDVLDLTDPLFKLRNKIQVFLKQDTHWTPQGMEESAKMIASHIHSMGFNFEKTQIGYQKKEERSGYGDLVENLKISHGFEKELVTAHPVQGSTKDINSEIILLGDSFTNIYSSNTSLGWGKEAGLPEHLAINLGAPLDVISINGGGATEVRKKLAQRRGSAIQMRNKKIMIWAITSRDLFQSASQRHETGIRWNTVKFNELDPKKESPSSSIIVRARLTKKPNIPNPQLTTYKDLLYGSDYEIIEKIAGEINDENGKIAVLNWAFKNRKINPSAEYALGREAIIELVPFEEMKELQTLEQIYDGDIFDLYWELPKNSDEKPEINQINARNAGFRHKIALITSGVFSIIIFLGTRFIPKHNF